MFQNIPNSTPKSAPAGSRSILMTVVVVQFMVSLDLSIVNVALPQIAGLGFEPLDLTWVIHAYALTFGGLLLLGGKAADLYGQRRVLLFGLVLFGVASLLGGFALEPWQLVLARAAQGVGAAALAPAALALLTATFPAGRARVRAFGIWSAVNAAGGALGVLIGGLLTEYLGWRAVMFVNLPIATVAFVLAWRTVSPAAVSTRISRLDVPGAVFATAGMMLLVFGVVRTDSHPWTSPMTVVTLFLSALLLAAFLFWERATTRDPLVRLGLFTNRSVAGANAYNLLLGGAMASAFYFISLHLQRVYGAGPATTGLQLLPFALGVVVGAALAVRLGYRLSPRTLLIGGGLITAFGFAWFGLMRPDGAFLTDVLGPSLVASVGFGLCLAPVVSMATVDVAPQEAGTAAGILNSSRQIGASLGLAVLGTVAQARTGSVATPESLTGGYTLGLWLCAALLVAAAIIAAIVLPRPVAGPGNQHISRSNTKGNSTMSTTLRKCSPIWAMGAGLALTLAALAFLYIDHATTDILAQHIRAGFPDYTPERIDQAAGVYLVYLAVLGAAGVGGWVVSIWLAARSWRGIPWIATALLVIGASVAVFNLTVTDVSGDTGLPPLLGWTGMLPCIAGVVAVALLWRRRPSRVQQIATTAGSR